MSGYTGSITSWYDEKTAEIETGCFGVNNSIASRVLNPSTICCMVSTEINGPTLIRSDVIHSVFNPNMDARCCLVVRWELIANHRYKFEEIVKNI